MDKKLSKKEKKKLKRLQKEKQQKANVEIQKQSKDSKQKNQKANQVNVRIKSMQNSSQKISQKHSNRKSAKKMNKQNKNKQEQSQVQQQDIKDKMNKGRNKIGQEVNDSQVEDQQQQYDLDFNKIVEGKQQIEEFSFLIAQINQKHYHSMKTILEKFSRLTSIMSSEWADTIISNSKAGNVVVVDDDDDNQEQDQNQNEDDEQEEEDDQDNVCSGVINLLPFSHKFSQKVVQKMKKSTQNKNFQCFGPIQPSQVLSKNCSLLICQRAINLPAFVVKSMHEVLVNDLKELQKSNNQQYKKLCSKYIVSMSQVEIPKQCRSSGKNQSGIDIQQIIYSRFEDYLFLKNSVCWWIGQSSPNSVRKVPLSKLYYAISVQKYFQSVALIHTLIDDQ